MSTALCYNKGQKFGFGPVGIVARPTGEVGQGGIDIVPSKKLAARRTVGRPRLAGEQARSVQFSPGGRYLAYLLSGPADAEPPSADACAIWLMDSATGLARPVLDSRALNASTPVDDEELNRFLQRRYQMFADPISFVWGTSEQRMLVVAHHGLFVVDVHSGAAELVKTLSQPVTDVQFAPGEEYVSFASDGSLHILSLAGGRDDVIGGTGNDAVSYGIAEFVAQEEMRRFTGQWWSPSGQHLAYARVDETNVRIVPRLQIGDGETSMVPERYPLAGTPNAAIQILVRHLRSGSDVKVDLGPTDDIYVAHATWSVDGSILYILRQSRDQKRLDLLAADPATGLTRILLTEQSDTWVDLERDFRPLANGDFLWGSSRSGWRHLYLYRPSGELVREVTSGHWRLANMGVGAPEDFASIVGVDEEAETVFFAASRDTPIEQQLYRVSYASPEEPVAITTGSGWWVPRMAAAGPTAFYAAYSDPDTPPNVALYDLNGERIAWLSENGLSTAHPYFAYLDDKPGYEYGTLPSDDGVDLHYVLTKPPGFDPAVRYPVIIRVYGGPNTQTVRREWRPFAEHLLTQEGYLTFQLDGRGSTNRDRHFEHALFGNLAGANTADQLAGIRFLRTLPFVDADRIGMMGGSFGGYMTVRVMTTPGAGVRAGAAYGVPADFALYDTHYTERFLGTPEENGRAYAEGALLTRMADLEGHLLLSHGLSDDNVTINNFTLLVSQLVKAGKLFETGVYPGMGHVPTGEDRQAHIWQTNIDFFRRRLG